MSSKYIEALRSVSLDVPDLEKAKSFYTQVWNLSVVHEQQDALFLAGSGRDHHLLALYRSDGLAIRDVTLRVKNESVLQRVQDLVQQARGTVISGIRPVSDPAGGKELLVADPQGRIYRLVHGDQLNPQPEVIPDVPTRLAHVVLNSDDVEIAQKFVVEAFDFRLSDRTRIMAFMNCNCDHHSIAFGDTTNNALNHIAFVMKDTDSVMRGGGRMIDAQYSIEWGPGRHGPGDNVFNYFIGPFGEVIEYTAEVEQIDDSYMAKYPDEWRWPEGRSDQWGVTKPPSDCLKRAQARTFFIPVHGESK